MIENTNRKINLIGTEYRLAADIHTPVGIYLKLRDRFPGSILLESADYRGQDNSYSYIACSPIALFKVQNDVLEQQFPGEDLERKTIVSPKKVLGEFQQFVAAFNQDPLQAQRKHITNGLFGFTTYSGVQYFEDIKLTNPDETKLPLIHYQAFRYIIAINHFNHELYLYCHQLQGEDNSKELEQLLSLVKSKSFPEYPFSLTDAEQSNFSDNEYLDIINKGIAHCKVGDVFQIVLSRRFSRKFKGDDFNVYRALRSINPSPYLFYFDYGKFKIFGSSPEAQIVVSKGKASIHPIAGTFKRTGNDTADSILAQKLAEDPKENAEHVMLVDLARNDLSRHCDKVQVDNFREIQYYSHVIHLVSKVSGKLRESTNSLQIVADTFPAGTLSGAPKFKAMQLIDEYENVDRGYYGGAIGFIGFNGDFNHAIMIRSMLSQDGKLTYQAGAGVVAKSDPQSELQEVHNKLGALRRALERASSESWQ